MNKIIDLWSIKLAGRGIGATMFMIVSVEPASLPTDCVSMGKF